MLEENSISVLTPAYPNDLKYPEICVCGARMIMAEKYLSLVAGTKYWGNPVFLCQTCQLKIDLKGIGWRERK